MTKLAGDSSAPSSAPPASSAPEVQVESTVAVAEPETAEDATVVKMALEMVEEEEEHVALLKKWQERFPKPEKGWDDDLDAPVISE